MTEPSNISEYLIPGTTPQIAAWYQGLRAASETFTLGLIEDDYIIFDTETTGFNDATCSLIEIAAARMHEGQIVERFQSFVNPGCHIPQEIVELTGITDADVADAPSPRAAVAKFAEFADGCKLVAHNASFDRAFIMRQAQAGMFSAVWIDTLALSQIALPRFKSHRLADLSRAFGLHKPSHRAVDDVEALCGVWRILICAIGSMEPGLAAAISGLAPETSWLLRDLFVQASAADTAHFSLRTLRSRQTSESNAPAKSDALEIPMRYLSSAEVDEAFSADGVAGAMYPGYEQREEQLVMAREVAEAFAARGFAVLEAGTGVGKSMAYLLPAALTARANHITVGVATKTNALMDQLVYHELPRLQGALGSLNYIALKGYDHYPCLRKVERMQRESEDEDVADIQALASLLSYIAQTSWGDLDALNIHWNRGLRTRIGASSADCLKKRCPFFPRRCYLHGARRQATSADILVTNHALLFRDIQADNGILPTIRHWIIDEAHAVEDEARRQLSLDISARDLDAALNRLAGSRGSVIAQVRAQASTLEGGSMLYGITADIDDRVAQIRSVSTSFFSFVKELEPDTSASSAYSRSTLWVNPELRTSGPWLTMERPGRSLADKLGSLIDRLRDLASMTEQFEEAFTAQVADLTNVTCDIEEMLQALVLVLEGEDDSYVYSAELDHDPSRTAEALDAAKLDIGEVLARDFYPSAESIVFTSATLATGNAKEPFDHYLRTTGLGYMDSTRVSCQQLASSYDFDRNMRIMLPSDIPEPAAMGYRTALADLLEAVHLACGGSVLTLFTNRREMESLYRELKPILREQGIELIAQTRGTSTKALRDRFLEDRSLSLFALKSFWEGFDAPGDTLRCVVIPKLPFGRPTDPIAQERQMRDGRNAWRKYSLPEAVVDLKQAVGRLIRRSTDSGWVILADARLQTKNYGSTFLRAMPTSNVRTLTTQEIAQAIRDER